MAKAVEQRDSVVIRFAGDSGDGMQLTGGQFTNETALLGNDLSTFPDFPAEIRAPAGSLPGVSGFQLHFADHDILTPGDRPDVLVAMNPAALKTNLKDLVKGGTLIVNRDAFTERNLDKAGYAANPLDDGSLGEFQVHEVPLTTMTIEALKEIDVTKREAERAKNMFALGLMSWLFNRPTDGTLAFLEKKFAKAPNIRDANVKALHAGYAFGETTEAFAVRYEVKPATLRPGTYRNITGNQALAYGLIAASKLSGLPLFLGAYPITPASAILEELARHKNFGVRTFQAEDEIAAVGAAVGASFGGALGVCTSAGPGVVLKQETIGLAITLELPLLILDIQRAGPSTGMPTKPEQGDLLMVLYGRNSESPVPVVAAATPGECFDGRDRGGADRDQVPHAGLPALGRLPRERLRAVAAAGPLEAAGHLVAVRDGDELERRLHAVPARPGDARAAVGGAGDAGSRAPDRRAREGRRHRQRLVRPRQPRPDGEAARPQGRRHRRRHPRARGRRSATARRCSCCRGAARTARSPPACGASARTAAASRTRTCVT